MSKLAEATGDIFYGPRRIQEELTGIWLRVAHDSNLGLNMEAKGIFFGRLHSDRLSNTVLCSVEATFDNRADGVYEWRRVKGKKGERHLYIEFPLGYVPGELLALVVNKEKGSSTKLPAILFKTGVLQIRNS